MEPTGDGHLAPLSERLVRAGQVKVGKGCAITACAHSGVFAWKREGGPGGVTVEDAGVGCEGNNTSNEELYGEYAALRGTIKGIAVENISTW